MNAASASRRAFQPRVVEARCAPIAVCARSASARKWTALVVIRRGWRFAAASATARASTPIVFDHESTRARSVASLAFAGATKTTATAARRAAVAYRSRLPATSVAGIALITLIARVVLVAAWVVGGLARSFALDLRRRVGDIRRCGLLVLVFALLVLALLVVTLRGRGCSRGRRLCPRAIAGERGGDAEPARERGEGNDDHDLLPQRHRQLLSLVPAVGYLSAPAGWNLSLPHPKRQPPRRRLSSLRTVANDCHQLRPPLHGKEDVCHRLPPLPTTPFLLERAHLPGLKRRRVARTRRTRFVILTRREGTRDRSNRSSGGQAVSSVQLAVRRPAQQQTRPAARPSRHARPSR